MNDIPNTEFITVKRDDKGRVGVFVGGKPATHYRGQEIYRIEYVQFVFEWMQKKNPNIAEFHIMSSKTNGEYAKTGNPSAEHGPSAWCRIVLKDGTTTDWVFHYTYGSAADCANACAYACAFSVRANASFRQALLGSAIDKQNVNPMAKSKNPEIEKLKTVDFSKLPKSPIELNGYEIVVRKLKTHTK